MTRFNHNKIDGPIVSLAGIKHSGTRAFANKVTKGRKKAKAARKARKRRK